jgi:hypothetical protein
VAILESFESLAKLRAAERRLRAADRRLPSMKAWVSERSSLPQSLSELFAGDTELIRGAIRGPDPRDPAWVAVEERMERFLAGFGDRDGRPPRDWVRMADAVARIRPMLFEELGASADRFLPLDSPVQWTDDKVDSVFVAFETYLLTLAGLPRQAAARLAARIADPKKLLRVDQSLQQRRLSEMADPVRYVSSRLQWAGRWEVLLERSLAQGSLSVTRKLMSEAWFRIGAQICIELDGFLDGIAGDVSQIVAIFHELIDGYFASFEEIEAALSEDFETVRVVSD